MEISEIQRLVSHIAILRLKAQLERTGCHSQLRIESQISQYELFEYRLVVGMLLDGRHVDVVLQRLFEYREQAARDLLNTYIRNETEQAA